MHADFDIETGQILIQGSDFLIRPRLTLNDLSGTRFDSYFAPHDISWLDKKCTAFQAREAIEISGARFFHLIYFQEGTISQLTFSYCPPGVNPIKPGLLSLLCHVVERAFASLPVVSLETEYSVCQAWLAKVTGSESATHVRSWGYFELEFHREREIVQIGVTYK